MCPLFRVLTNYGYSLLNNPYSLIPVASRIVTFANGSMINTAESFRLVITTLKVSCGSTKGSTDVVMLIHSELELDDSELYTIVRLISE